MKLKPGDRVHHVAERWNATVLESMPTTPKECVRVRSDGGYTGEYDRDCFVRIDS